MEFIKELSELLMKHDVEIYLEDGQINIFYIREFKDLYLGCFVSGSKLEKLLDKGI